MSVRAPDLLPRCHFPTPGTALDCAFSGGPDSTALLILALAAGCHPVAHHVDHGLRPESADEARRAAAIADRLDVEFVLHRRRVEPGPNVEARARAVRYAALPSPVATGHTLDDQAETMLLRLLRGAGTTGLAAIGAGPTHPLLAIRRAETAALCAAVGIEPVRDPTNDHVGGAHTGPLGPPRRSRVRHELVPLANDIACRDVAPVLARTAALLGEDDRFLDELAATIDATDARAVAAAPPVLARRALRRWLTEAGYPPDRAAIERVLGVARGDAVACELPGGRRVRRSGQRFDIVLDDR